MVATYADSIFHHILREAIAVFDITEIRLVLLKSADASALNSCNFGSEGGPMFLQKTEKYQMLITANAARHTHIYDDLTSVSQGNRI